MSTLVSVTLASLVPAVAALLMAAAPAQASPIPLQVAAAPRPDAVPAQTAPPDATLDTVPDATRVGDRYTIHMVTMGPGDAVWERFGHNGLRVVDHLTGQDSLFEWGLFYFQQVDFIPRLVRGEMLYSMAAAETEAKLAQYRATNRQVWSQELALTPPQEVELVDALFVNYQEENREYLYDYYEDNCSTRLRDALDAALDGALHDQLQGIETGHSWRWHTRRLVQGDPWAYIGIQFVLGHPGDEQIDRWQEMFLPLQLRDAVANATVPTPDGGRRPLVVTERVLVESTRPPAPQAPDSWLLRAALIGLAAAMVLLGLGALGSSSGAARVVLGLLGGAVSLVLGLAGTIVLIAGLFTDHDFWAWNETVLLASPLSLALALLLLPLCIGKRPSAAAERLARWISALALAALLIRILPVFGQANLEVIAVLLPVQLGLAGAIARARLHPAREPAPSGPR